MNVSEYAKQMGVSRATLYRKASVSGIDIETLRDVNGELTEQGLQVLSSVLDGTARHQTVSNVSDTDTYKRQIDELTERLKTAETRVYELQNEIIRLHEQAASEAAKHAEALKTLAEKQLDVEKLRLTAQKEPDKPQTNKASWWQRFKKT